MAGRNRKNCAEYFSHDADASSDEKIIYLESKFGHMGYAVYFKFLERMTRADNFELEWNDIKKAVYASEFNISVAEIEQIVSECCRQEIKAFQIEDGKLFSIGLRKRMQPLLDKREYNRKKYEEKKAKQTRRLSKPVTENGNSADEKTQSKGKESKDISPYSPPKGVVGELKNFLLENIPENFNGTKPKIIEFFEYRMQKPKAKRYQSTKGVSGLFRDLNNCQAAGYDLATCIDITMEKNWQTPSVDYFKPEMFQDIPAQPQTPKKTNQQQIEDFLS